jgi:hypothetical protein
MRVDPRHEAHPGFPHVGLLKPFLLSSHQRLSMFTGFPRRSTTTSNIDVPRRYSMIKRRFVFVCSMHGNSFLSLATFLPEDGGVWSPLLRRFATCHPALFFFSGSGCGMRIEKRLCESSVPRPPQIIGGSRERSPAEKEAPARPPPGFVVARTRGGGALRTRPQRQPEDAHGSGCTTSGVVEACTKI